MHNKKKQKTIDDYSVSQLLDDFIKEDVQVNGRSLNEIDDEEYIRMMLKKDALRKLERTKRDLQIQEHRKASSTQSDTIDDDLRKRFFPEVSEKQAKKKLPPKERESSPDDDIVEEILDSIVVKDVSGLAARMKEAVDFLQEEMGESEAERKLVEALEEYRKSKPSASAQSMHNDNVLLLKRCQNCHFCVGEKNRKGSVWCLCTNLDRSAEVEIDDSWVKSELNLSCWKAP